MSVWGQPAKGRSNGSSVASSVTKTDLDIFLIEETARCTKELLSSSGWCLWKCSSLGDEVIIVVRDGDVKGVPQDYPVYTEAELDQLCQDDVSNTTLQLVHEAKKLAGAKVL